MANSLWLIFLSRMMDGFTAGNISLAQAYIADVTKPEERTKSFAVIGIAFGVGFLIGPAISGYLAQYQYPISGICGDGSVGNQHCRYGRSSPVPQTLTGRSRRAPPQRTRVGYLCRVLSSPGSLSSAVAILCLHLLLFAVHVRISFVR